MANAANLVNFGTAGGSLAVGDWTYSLYALSAPGYLPLTSNFTTYSIASYPTLSNLLVTPVTPVSYVATSRSFGATLPSNAGCVYGAGLFVAFAGCGSLNVLFGTAIQSSAMFTSPDAITWTARTVPSIYWSAMTYGNNMFVAVTSPRDSLGGTNSGITGAYSANGINWTTSTLPFSGNYSGVAYGGNTYVAVASSAGTASSSAQYATSIDGINWTTRTIVTGSYYAVVFGGDTFLTFASSGLCYSSTDYGLTFVQKNNTAIPIIVTSAAYGNGTFVAVSTSGTSAYSSSDGGETWTARTLPGFPGGAGSGGVTYANNNFVVTCHGGAQSLLIYTSPDGITWTQRSLINNNRWAGIAFGGGVFAVTSQSATPNSVVYATAATTFNLPKVQPVIGTTAYVKAT